MEENQTVKDFVFNPDIEMRLANAKMTLEIKTSPIPNWMSRLLVFKVKYSITKYTETDSGSCRLRPKIKLRENFKLSQLYSFYGLGFHVYYVYFFII